MPASSNDLTTSASANGPDAALDRLLPDRWVRPSYDGAGFASIPATVGAVLDAPVGSLPPLADRLWRPLADGVERVVVLLLDGLGWPRLERSDPAWLDAWRADGGVAAPITSVCPSTTAAATTTFWTGAAPAAHGILGFTQHLPQVGSVCDMIFFRHPLSHRTGEVVDWGLEPKDLSPVRTVAQWLGREGIPTVALKHKRIINSPLSALQLQGVAERRSYLGASDLWVALRERLEDTAGQRTYIAAYWPHIDTLSHDSGPADPRWDAEWRALRRGLEDELLARLSPAGRKDVLLAITADHGLVGNTEDEIVQLSDHPALAAMLHTLPAGDPRHVYLWPRRGAADELRDYAARELPGFALFERDALLAAGLYGPAVWDESVVRMGPYVLMSRGRQMLFWLTRGKPFLGMHGGLLPEEARVPWLARRLD